jgi:hypothetical protein
VATGDYTVRFAAESHHPLDEIRVNVFIDELSIDVGPGAGDPTGAPYLPCEEPTADPDYCFIYAAITPRPPTSPEPPAAPSESGHPWWWDYGFDCRDYSSENFDWVQIEDPLWWEFYVEVCQATPSGPTPTSPTPSDTDVSPWQNGQNRFDVTGNDFVTAQDVLVIINLLVRNIGEPIRVTDTAANTFADVNGDFFVTAADALTVINAMAQARPALDAAMTIGSVPSSGLLSTASDTERKAANDAAIGLLF